MIAAKVTPRPPHLTARGAYDHLARAPSTCPISPRDTCLYTGVLRGHITAPLVALAARPQFLSPLLPTTTWFPGAHVPEVTYAHDPVTPMASFTYRGRSPLGLFQTTYSSPGCRSFVLYTFAAVAHVSVYNPVLPVSPRCPGWCPSPPSITFTPGGADRPPSPNLLVFPVDYLLALRSSLLRLQGLQLLCRAALRYQDHHFAVTTPAGSPHWATTTALSRHRRAGLHAVVLRP